MKSFLNNLATHQMEMLLCFFFHSHFAFTFFVQKTSYKLAKYLALIMSYLLLVGHISQLPSNSVPTDDLCTECVVNVIKQLRNIFSILVFCTVKY